MIEIYPPCDVCGAKPENDMIFTRRQLDGWLQYSLCNKHLPNTPRVWIWQHQWRVGRALATMLGLGIGYSGCMKCGTPWDCVRSHITYYTPDGGVFVLCTKCWQELTPEQRLPYYDKLIAEWGRDCPKTGSIRTAVLEGK